MSSRLFKIVLPGLALLFIQACSHPIEIVGEGDVRSFSERKCLLEDHAAGLENCSKNYVIDAYQETYRAYPRQGWKFDHWGNCMTVSGNFCSFDVPAESVHASWGKVVPSLQAVFTEAPDGIPISNTVIALDNREWAQPGLFTGGGLYPNVLFSYGLTWDEISAVCPLSNGGICTGKLAVTYAEGDEQLNEFNYVIEYDMNGWTWASVEDMNTLFNVYANGSCVLGPGPDVCFTGGSPLVKLGSKGDFGPTASHPLGGILVDGWTATPVDASTTHAYLFKEAYSFFQSPSYEASSIITLPRNSRRGAWFYRTP